MGSHGTGARRHTREPDPLLCGIEDAAAPHRRPRPHAGRLSGAPRPDAVVRSCSPHAGNSDCPSFGSRQEGEHIREAKREVDPNVRRIHLVARQSAERHFRDNFGQREAQDAADGDPYNAAVLAGSRRPLSARKSRPRLTCAHRRASRATISTSHRDTLGVNSFSNPPSRYLKRHSRPPAWVTSMNSPARRKAGPVPRPRAADLSLAESQDRLLGSESKDRPKPLKGKAD